MVEVDERDYTYTRECRILLDGDLICTLHQRKDYQRDPQWENVEFTLNGGLTGSFAHDAERFPGVIESLQKAHEVAVRWKIER